MMLLSGEPRLTLGPALLLFFFVNLLLFRTAFPPALYPLVSPYSIHPSTPSQVWPGEKEHDLDSRLPLLYYS